ncbi:MAG: flagellar motor stator protein MotA [Rhodospirillaceae bacterium]|jgi:chemotaxis protein MotA|nr:flagellar motor stator protein MotA [Rhodospirillaceae bacterium]MBT4687047.1 flagellar motor stator protein MotA [Rhodospirillaceae bacterium]MBT5082563.1 flagellar motor stator protein MotA [Rhodospirillaceae bacterium]MBT5526107.1 flagellar motor stator protein MotA [Rhodospirillaceae bacterium]MBT5879636.1 flagellar motor stator protein MotA [Rhodospirillaceae bacterium]
MFFIIGLVVVFGSVAGGYAPHGDFRVLWQPLEFLIILGAAVGGFIISNPKDVTMATGKHLGRLLKSAPYGKQDYVELLCLQFSLFKLAKSKGALALEAHIENPDESAIFSIYPTFMKNHDASDFLCDTLRLITMGTENPHELEAMMDEDIESRKHEAHSVAHAVAGLGEGLPAFGIVAAVLGVIVTMGSISEPPEVLGGLIGAALVGTFFGIFMAYGVVSPMGAYLTSYCDAEFKYLECMKAGVLAHVQGYAPAISVEFARKTLASHDRPSFTELEDATSELAPA